MRARERGDIVDTRTNGSGGASDPVLLVMDDAVDAGRCNGAIGDGNVDDGVVGDDAGLNPAVVGRRCVAVNGASSLSSSKSGSKSVATCTG